MAPTLSTLALVAVPAAVSKSRGRESGLEVAWHVQSPAGRCRWPVIFRELPTRTDADWVASGPWTEGVRTAPNRARAVR